MQHYISNRDNFDATYIGNLHLNQTCLCGLLVFSSTKLSVYLNPTKHSNRIQFCNPYLNLVYWMYKMVYALRSVYCMYVHGKRSLTSMNYLIFSTKHCKSKLYKNRSLYSNAKTAYKLLLLLRNSDQICLWTKLAPGCLIHLPLRC